MRDYELQDWILQSLTDTRSGSMEISKLQTLRSDSMNISCNDNIELLENVAKEVRRCLHNKDKV